MYLLLYINITRPLIANAHGINVYQRHCMRNTWQSGHFADYWETYKPVKLLH